MALLAVLLLGAGAVVLLPSLRHRDVYFGQPGLGVAATRGLARPDLSLRTAPATAGVATDMHFPVVDVEGQVRVPVGHPPGGRLPSSGPPAGWEVTAFTGEPAIEVVRSEGRVAVRLRSERTSFALHRDVVVDVREHPILTWTWKVTRLPTGGDVREAERDDQAAQVYVMFPRWPSPRTSSHVIGYVWDTRAPEGTMLVHRRAANVRIVVVRSGAGQLDTWVREQRNVAEDHQALFGSSPPRVGRVALMIDTNDTRSEAEALFGDLTFGPAAASTTLGNTNHHAKITRMITPSATAGSR